MPVFSLHVLLLTRIGVGAFQEYYQNVMLKQFSSSTIAWIPSLQIFFMMAMVSDTARLRHVEAI